MWVRIRLKVALALVLVSACFGGVVWACPGCKEAAFDTAQQSRAKLAASRGYALSIGLMLVVPAALIGAVSLQIARASKRNPFDTPDG